MFARNLQAGEFVTVVPLGLPITIQYGEKGSVERVYTGHEASKCEDVTDEILTTMLINKQIPNHVATNNSVCYVHAVMYSSELQFGRGRLPDCVIGKYVDAYKKDPKRFTVYAGDMQSQNNPVNSTPVAIRQWLTMNQFNLLPGYVVPSELDEPKFESMVKKNFPFRYPLIPSFILFGKDSSVSYPSTGLTMFQADSVKQIVDQCGSILGVIKEKNSDTEYTVPYPQVVHNDIQKNTYLVSNSEGAFIYVENGKNTVKLPRKITCSGCGKQLFVPAANVMSFKCDDPQCNSVLFPRVTQMLNVLNLPSMSFDRYKEVTEKIGPIFGLIDVFDLDEYKDIETEVTIQDVVRAIIPKEILPGRQQVQELCEGCNNSEEVLTYYFQHPEAIISDLQCDEHAFSKLVKWLNNLENCSDCVEILKVPNIKIIQKKQYVDGSPIFRDKKIYITGTFTHGRLDDIAGILEGYSAEVIRKFDQSADCIVVGDIPENVNGHAISQAKLLQIPVMQETSFFTMYGIDNDLFK